MKRTVTTIVALLLAIPALAFAKAKIEAPSQARVGDVVHVSASGLAKGRYALTLSADNVLGKDTACVARLAQADKASTSVSLEGRIPAKLTCWTNDSVRGGKIETAPGRYHLIVAVPDGPSGFKGSFVRAPITLKPPRK